MGKTAGGFSSDFSTNPHFFLLFQNVVSKPFKSVGAFFLILSEDEERVVVGVGEKGFFCGCKDSGKWLAKSVGCGVFSKKRSNGKHFT